MSEPKGPETSAELEGATAPEAPAANLTPRERRAIREQERKAFRAQVRAELAAKTGAKDAKGPPAPKAAAPEAPAEPERTDAARAADAAAFLRGVVWPVVSLFAGLLGYRLAELTEGEAADDAAAWVPLCRRYRWLDVTVTVAAMPARLIGRVRTKASRKPAAGEKRGEVVELRGKGGANP